MQALGDVSGVVAGRAHLDDQPSVVLEESVGRCAAADQQVRVVPRVRTGTNLAVLDEDTVRPAAQSRSQLVVDRLDGQIVTLAGTGQSRINEWGT